MTFSIELVAIQWDRYQQGPLISNGGFETGDFTGWTVTLNGGTAQAVIQHTGDAGTVYDPVEGNYFALIKTDGPGSMTTATTEIDMCLGATLKGWAAFDAQDYTPFVDYAKVRILDSDNNVMATPYYEVCTEPIPGPYKDLPWTEWQWTAPSAGIYTIELTVSNAGDSILDSYGLFDAHVIE